MREVIDHADGVRAERESGARHEAIGRFWLASPPAPPRHCRGSDGGGCDRRNERPEGPGSRSADGSDRRGASARQLIPDPCHMENPSSNARRKEEPRGGRATPELLSCSFCGGLLRDTAEENLAHGIAPSPFDEGRGLCRRCGGDPDAKTPEGRVGDAMLMFVRARVRVVAERLSSKHRVKFLAMPLEEQARVIVGLVERGTIR